MPYDPLKPAKPEAAPIPQEDTGEPAKPTAPILPDSPPAKGWGPSGGFDLPPDGKPSHVLVQPVRQAPTPKEPGPGAPPPPTPTPPEGPSNWPPADHAPDASSGWIDVTKARGR